MQTLLYRVTIYVIFIVLMLLFSLDVKGAESPFEIQVFDGETKETHPYRLISGKRYRLQAVTSDNSVLPAEWFLSGNLGRITTDISPMLTAVFVGEGSLICRVAGVEGRVPLSVVPETKTIGDSGGKLQSPAGVTIELPEGALTIEHKIGIEIVAPPGLPPLLEGFSTLRCIRISPERLVLKRPGQLTFLFGSSLNASRNPLNPPYQGDTDRQQQLYFWETFAKKWVSLQGSNNTIQGSVSTSINHFGIYALIAATSEGLKRSEQLQIQSVKLSPRVFFAPDRHPLTIAYRLNAPDATQIFVTMEIFDLRGRRVRRLLEEIPFYIGANAVQWDGLTDAGVLVRNGRYLLVIRARTGLQQAMYRKLIVVFK